MINKHWLTIGTLLCMGTLMSNALAWKSPEKEKPLGQSTAATVSDNPFKRGFRGMKPVSLENFNDAQGRTPMHNKLSGNKAHAGDSAQHRFNRHLAKYGAEVRLTGTQEDKLGNRHIRMMQYINQMPVVGSDIIVHVNKNNEIYLVSGTFSPFPVRQPTALLSNASAIAMAKNCFPSDSVYIEGAARLVVFDSTVAYEVSAEVAEPQPQKWKLFIDARSGTLLGKLDQLFRAAPGTQGSHVPVTGYRLTGEDGSLVTIDGWHDTNGNYFLYHKNQRWGVYNLDTPDWEQRSTASWGTSDRAAVSLANNFAITQNFVIDEFGRNSFDGLGTLAQANVHEGTSYVNAYWDGSDFHFGDGDGSQAGPLTTLDISAHEYGHAITQYTSNLVYSYESGALNESYSDILGTWIEFRAQPDGRSSYPQGLDGQSDWLCGEDCWLAGDALRDLRDPLRYSNPSYYMGTYWYTGSGDNGGVHYNSGVQNKAFYLLAEGGSGSNDGHPYNLVGMGVDAAGQIAMYADMYLLTSGSQYRDARNAWIQAAVTLGYNADRVGDAWAAVGILPLVRHLGVTPATLAFDSVGIGVADTMVVMLSNNGGDATLVSALTFSNPAFSAATSMPFSVAGGATLPLRIVYAPTSYGVTSGVLTITSNAADNPVLTVSLSGTGVTPAVIATTPRSLSRTVAVGDSTTAMVTITNNGQAKLKWSVTANDATQVPVAPAHYDVTHFIAMEKGASDTRIGLPVTTLQGGPDNFGYTWIDSDEPAGPAFQWNDIRATGTMLSTVSGCDDCYQLQSLSFDFPFYDNNFNAIYVSSNGHITFGTGSSQIANYPLPSINAPANLIDALHDDLYPGAGGDIYFRDYGDRAVIQFDNVYPYSGSGVYTFQIVLENSGVIRLYYNNLTGPLTGATVGIQNGTQDDGLTVVYNATYLKNLLAVKFSPRVNWLSATPPSGILSAGQSAAVQVAFNGAVVAGGIYYGRLDLLHNAPGTPSPVAVPCTLHVDGIRRLAAAPSSVDFGAHWVGTRDTATITLSNSGDEATVVSSVTSSNSYFRAIATLPLTVPAFGSAALRVEYAPGALGNHSATLAVSSNAEDNPSISVPCTGSGATPPSIEISPLSFSESLLAGDSVSRDLIIRNAGGAALDYSINGPSGGAGTDSLKAYWRFNENVGTTAYDASPYSNNGIITGAAWSTGHNNAGLAFDGVDDHVAIPGNSSLNITRSITLAAWVLPTTPSKQWQRIICKDNETTSSAYILGISSYGGIYFSLFYGGSQYYISGTTPLQAGVWSHIAGTWDGTTMRIYLNGIVQSQTRAFTGSIGITSDSVRIGRTTSSSYAFIGSIDEARIYSRALPNSDITALFENGAGWLSVSSMQGTVAPAETDTLKVRFSTRDILGGNYLGSLTVSHNAPGTPSPLAIPCTLLVDGTRRLAAAPSSLNFGAHQVGTRDTATITLSNSGNEASVVSSVNSSNPYFARITALPLTVPAFGNAVLRVEYVPGSVGSHGGTLTINSNAEDNPSIAVSVTGTGTSGSQISVSPSSFSKTLLPSGRVSDILYITNSGATALTYSIETSGATLPVRWLQPQNWDTSKTEENGLLFNGTIPGAGTSLAYGYPFYDGFEAGTRDNWDNGSGVYTTQITSATAARGFNSLTMIGGNTRHYDGLQAQFPEAHQPGVVSFSVRSASTSASVGYFSLGGDQTCAVFFCMTGDGYLYTNGNYSYRYSANRWYDIRYVIDWSARTADYFVNDTLIAEDLPFRDQVSTVSSVYLYNMTNSQAWWDNINIGGATANDWLVFSPTSGTVAPGQSTPVSMQFSGGNQVGGKYTMDLQIHNTTTGLETVAVPCTLTIDGFRRLAVTPASLDFQSVWVGSEDTLLLMFSNTGNEATRIQSVTSNNPLFAATGLPVTVPPLGSIRVPVVFHPGTVGNHTAVLTVSSNAEDYPTLTVACAGSGILSPQISVTPRSFSRILDTGAVANGLLRIKNNVAAGGADLRFTIDIPGFNTLLPDEPPALIPPSTLNVNTDNIWSGQKKVVIADTAAPAPEQRFNASGLNVLYINTHIPTDGTDDFSAGLRSLSNIDTVKTLNCQTSTPNLAYLMQYDIVVISSYAWFADTLAMGNVLADFVDAGGKVCLLNGTFCFRGAGEWTLGGRIMRPQYSPFALTDGAPDQAVVQTLSNHPINRGVTSITTGFYSYITALQGNSVSLGTFSNGYHLGACNSERPVVAVNIQPLNGEWGGDLLLMMGNVFDYFADSTWLTLSKISDTLAPGDSSIITVTFNAHDLSAGTHVKTLLISHNAPGSSTPVAVPCTLAVRGFRGLRASPASINFDPLPAGLRDTMNVTLSNTGGDMTTISSLFVSNAVFLVPATVPFTIPPLSAVQLPVIFTPPGTGTFTGALTINSNAFDNPVITVALSGMAISGPSIEISPLLIIDTLVAGDSILRPVALLNSGSDGLVWSVTARETWLTVSPNSGTTNGGQLSIVQLSIRANGLQPGIYYDTIRVNHNDPLHASPLEIPVTLQVDAAEPGRLQGSILSIGSSAVPLTAGTRFRIVGLQLASPVVGRVQGNRYQAILR